MKIKVLQVFVFTLVVVVLTFFIYAFFGQKHTQLPRGKIIPITTESSISNKDFLLTNNNYVQEKLRSIGAIKKNVIKGYRPGQGKLAVTLKSISIKLVFDDSVSGGIFTLFSPTKEPIASLDYNVVESGDVLIKIGVSNIFFTLDQEKQQRIPESFFWQAIYRMINSSTLTQTSPIYRQFLRSTMQPKSFFTAPVFTLKNR